MSDSKTTVFRRRPVPVEIDGQTVHIRALTMKEALAVEGMKSEATEAAAVRYAVSRALIDASGAQVFDDDSAEVDDIPMDTLAELFAAIQRVTSPAPSKAIAKN